MNEVNPLRNAASGLEVASLLAALEAEEKFDFQDEAFAEAMVSLMALVFGSATMSVNGGVNHEKRSVPEP